MAKHPRRWTVPLLALGFLLLAGNCGPGDSQLSPAEALLRKSIDYHDPENQWSLLTHRLTLEESRPNGVIRKTSIEFGPTRDFFSLQQARGEDLVEANLRGGKVAVSLNGSAVIPEDKKDGYRLSEQGIAWWRNYYTYLYGLPMKLRDPGTVIHETVQQIEFEGQACLTFRVTYDEQVGKDTWDFYFDPQSFALRGYRFFHNEAENDGEFVVLEGEIQSGQLRLPQVRRWYTNKERTLLGSDMITSYELGSE